MSSYYIEFHSVTRCIYYDELELNVDELAEEIMYCAKKYMLTKLLKQCVNMLGERLTVMNACSFLQASSSVREDLLNEACLEFIERHAEKIFEQSHHTGLHRDLWKKVIQSDKLCAKETTITQACIEWGKVRCEENNRAADAQNVREELGDILYDIRFPCMSLEEFSTFTKEWDILDKSELREMIQYFGCTNRDKDKLGISFCKNVRRSNCVEICRFSTTNKVSWYVGKNTIDRISLKSDCAAEIHAVLVYGGTHENSCHEATVQISDQSGTVIGQRIPKIVSDGTPKHCCVYLDKPAKVTKDALYTISLEMVGSSQTFCGDAGISVVSNKNITVNFHNSPLDYNGTTVSGGQIPGIIICADRNAV